MGRTSRRNGGIKDATHRGVVCHRIFTGQRLDPAWADEGQRERRRGRPFTEAAFAAAHAPARYSGLVDGEEPVVVAVAPLAPVHRHDRAAVALPHHGRHGGAVCIPWRAGAVGQDGYITFGAPDAAHVAERTQRAPGRAWGRRRGRGRSGALGADEDVVAGKGWEVGEAREVQGSVLRVERVDVALVRADL